ncbi:unnamed protein product [Ectocarpus sp. 8 AP-2014]
MAGPGGNNQYESYQTERETTFLLSRSPSPLSSSSRSRDRAPASTVTAPEEDVPKHYKYALGMGYMLAFGVCGMVLGALVLTLDDLASNSGKTAIDVRPVLIARGVGAVLGTAASSKLYLWVPSNKMMSVFLFLVMVVLVYMPFITSVYPLYVAFLLLGLFTAITDTGCQIMTRKLHGAEAGPWMGANALAFGLSGVIVPLIGYLTGSLFVVYVTLSVVSCVTAVFLTILPTPGRNKGLHEAERQAIPAQRVGDGGGSREESQASAGKLTTFFLKYKIEFHISGMLFWLFSGEVGAAGYLKRYVDETEVIGESHAELLVVVLWMAIIIGRLAGIQDQRHLTLSRLYRHSTILFLGGTTAATAILVFQNSTFVLWTGIAAYGLCDGPTVGYCYDLNNRMATPSEMGTSVAMLGQNFGASIAPYVISWVWDYTDWPQILILVILLSHLLPYPFMLNAKRIDEANKRRLREEAISSGPYETRLAPSFFL